MTGYDVIVVGAGISGMSFAYYAAKAGLKTLVLEKDHSSGGCIHSERLENGFWFELGAHTCYNSYRTLLEILQERSLLDRLLKRAKVPFRLLADGAIRPISKELRLLELLRSAPRILTTSKDGMSVRAYYSRLVGLRNYGRVFGPLFAAVPSQRADDFPADMLFKKRERRKDVPRSFTMVGGLQTMIDSIAGDSRITLDLCSEVVSLARTDDGVSLVLADGRRYGARYASLAVPPPVAATLLRSDFPGVAEALSLIKTSCIHTLGLVLRRDCTPIEPVAGIIPLDYRFYSAVSRDTVPDPNWRGFAFHFRAGVTRDEALRQATMLLAVEGNAIEHVAERDVVLPSPVVGHQQIVLSIDKHIVGTPLFITGNYFGGLAIEDCVLRSRAEAARLTRA